MTSLGIPFPETEAGSFLRAECAGEDSSLPRIIVQCHLYSDFLGGPGVGVSAVFLLTTRRYVRKTQAVHNTEDSTAPATGLWLTDSDSLDAILPKVPDGPMP